MTVRSRSTRMLAMVIAVTAVVAVGGWTLLVAPERDEVEALWADVALKQDELARRLRETAAVPVAETVLASGVSQVTTALPDRNDLSAVLVNVDRLARANGLAFRSVTPSPESVGSGLRALPLTLTVEGRFSSVSRFLHDLRSTVRTRDGRIHARGQAYSVTDIVLGAGKDRAFPIVEATVTVNAHAFDPTPAPAGEAPAPAPGTGATVAAGADA